MIDILERSQEIEYVQEITFQTHKPIILQVSISKENKKTD